MTTPDYAGLIGWLQFFSQGDEKSPHARAAQAIRALLESNAALERERTNLIETKREQIGRLQKERDEWKAAFAMARAKEKMAESAEAERDRLAERVAELEKALEPFALVAEELSNAFSDDDVLSNIAGKRQLTAGDFRTARSLVKGGVDGR